MAPIFLARSKCLLLLQILMRLLQYPPINRIDEPQMGSPASAGDFGNSIISVLEQDDIIESGSELSIHEPTNVPPFFNNRRAKELHAFTEIGQQKNCKASIR